MKCKLVCFISIYDVQRFEKYVGSFVHDSTNNIDSWIKHM